MAGSVNLGGGEPVVCVAGILDQSKKTREEVTHCEKRREEKSLKKISLSEMTEYKRL